MSPSPRLTPDDLTTIRQNTNWRQLFEKLGLQRDPQKSQDHDWWARSPFAPKEKTPSFHINPKGWYCHSTNQGGGSIELVQRLHGEMKCYEAGRWLLEQGVSSIAGRVQEALADLEKLENEEAGQEIHDDRSETVNLPIRQNLVPLLDPEHPAFTERGIPTPILRELGAGYLDRPLGKRKSRDLMNHRLVFQIRGLRLGFEERPKTVTLGHIGRALTEEQAERDGKWWTYPGFHKRQELYGIDLVILDQEAREQAQKAGFILVVEGCFDLAKLRAAGIKNVVATFGSQLSIEQALLLQKMAVDLDVSAIRLFFDRDQAGINGAHQAIEELHQADLDAAAFDWEKTWETPDGKSVGIPDSITDPAEFSIGQLQWLRQEGLI